MKKGKFVHTKAFEPLTEKEKTQFFEELSELFVGRRRAVKTEPHCCVCRQCPTQESYVPHTWVRKMVNHAKDDQFEFYCCSYHKDAIVPKLGALKGH